MSRFSLLPRTVRAKLTLLLVVFGLLPALAILVVFRAEKPDLERLARSTIQNVAIATIDVIERNLFERYGDVQAFGLNGYAHDPANWRKPDDSNPLVAAMNGYMTNYGLYRLMLLVDPKGEVLAVNSQNAEGKALKTEGLYKRSFARAPWLAKALKGEFLAGTNGLTGTVMLPPLRDADVAAVYGDDGFTIVFAAPVKNAAGETIGVWANFADFGLVDRIVEQFYSDIAERGMAHAELTVIDRDGALLVDFDPDKLADKKVKRDHAVIGQMNLAKAGVEAAVAALRGGNGSIEARHARKGILQAAGYAHSKGAYDYPGLGWSVLVRASTDEAYAPVYAVQRAIWIAIGAFGLASVLGGLWIGTLAARPLLGMTEAMAKLAGKDWTTAVPALDRKDEIGRMAKAVQVFKEGGIENERLQKEADESRRRQMAQEDEERRRKEQAAIAEAERKRAAAEADRLAAEERRAAEERQKAEAEARRKAELRTLADGFESTVKTVVEAVSSSATEMQSSSTSMAEIADRTSRQATAVAAASEQASANVQTVASASEELSSSIQEIARQVGESSRVARDSVEQARQTGHTVDRLAQAAGKIGDVVKLITDIAAQTNLLALNATIEAARAGEAGKGFAVVASEVKTLATQTSRATDEITREIQAVQGVTGEAVQAIEGIGRSIERINDIATSISAAMEEQGAATQEIARNVQQAAAGTQDVNKNIGSVTQASGEVGAAAAQMNGASAGLSRQAETLRSEVDRFIARVRAG